MMLLGFFNAPASFQRYINKILVKKLNALIIEYLDNIFNYIKAPGQAYKKSFEF